MFDYGNQLYKNGNYEEALLEYLKSMNYPNWLNK